MASIISFPDNPIVVSNDNMPKPKKSKKDVKHQQLPLPRNFVPGKYDVIVGRGKKCYDHVGNQDLQRIVNSKLAEYSSSKSKFDKSCIISTVVCQIRMNGGFVKEDHGLWFDIGDHLAKHKVAQTFRDSLSSKYKSSYVFKNNKRKRREGTAKNNSSNNNIIIRSSNSTSSRSNNNNSIINGINNINSIESIESIDSISNINSMSSVGFAEVNGSDIGGLDMSMFPFHYQIPCVGNQIQSDDQLLIPTVTTSASTGGSSDDHPPVLSLTSVSSSASVPGHAPTPASAHASASASAHASASASASATQSSPTSSFDPVHILNIPLVEVPYSFDEDPFEPVPIEEVFEEDDS